MASIEKKLIIDLLKDNKKKYFIPSYQRGYKWTEREVTDLLDDITKYEKNEKSLYLLQPIVVKENKNKEKDYDYELIDGQQRLTTIYIILCYLLGDEEQKKSLYTIEYETREKSQDYLGYFQDYQKNFDSLIKAHIEDNSDFFYMNNAYKTVQKFFSEGKGINTESDFRDKLLNYTEVIWYVSNGVDEKFRDEEEEKSTDVFKRLNIGKIPLENSELLKARFLSSANFGKVNGASKQASIAIEWDNIEYTLQNEQFWYFIYGEEYKSANRINYIFDLIRILDRNKVEELYNNSIKKDNNDAHKDFNQFIGSDEKRTFRYIDFYISKKEIQEGREKVIDDLWLDVKKIFRIFTEWYNDIELYHYIGFLINCHSNEKSAKRRMITILQDWYRLSGDDDNNDTTKKGKLKVDFINLLKHKITAQLKKDLRYDDLVPNVYDNFKDLIEKKHFFDSREGTQTEDDDIKIDKTKTYNLLLLHNLETIVKQHANYEKYEDKFTGGFFTKFPFNLFKNDKWEIEHINPAVPNEKDCKDYLMGASKATYLFDKDEKLESENNDAENLKDRINKALGYCYHKTTNPDDLNFCQNVMNEIKEKEDELNHNEEESKINYIQNYVLLDKSTNSGYGNAFFWGKRLYIIGKDQGKQRTLDIFQDESNKDKYYVDEVKDNAKKDNKPFISFVLPCTKNVFLKYYSADPSQLLNWDNDDATSYLENITTVLSDFLIDDVKVGDGNNE